MTRIVVQPAATVEARAEVFRFRHDRGVRPSETLLPGARVSGGALRDALDPLAILLTARDRVSGILLGAVRVNFAHEGLDHYPALYAFGTLEPGACVNATVTSGWVVAWDALGLEVPLALSRGVYDLLRRERVRYDYLDCTPAEQPFFESLGYRGLHTVHNPNRGVTRLMRLEVSDEAGLRAIGSPLLEDPCEAAG